MDFIRNIDWPPSISRHMHFAVICGRKMPDDIFEFRMTDQLSCGEGWPEIRSDWLVKDLLHSLHGGVENNLSRVRLQPSETRGPR